MLVDWLGVLFGWWCCIIFFNIWFCLLIVEFWFLGIGDDDLKLFLVVGGFFMWNGIFCFGF